jgi:hypothetical protein
MFKRPLSDFLFGSIGATVVVRAVPISRMQPRLIVPLELVVEDDPLDASPAFLQPLGLAFVGSMDLKVVSEFPFTLEARVERLTVLLVAPAMALQKTATVFRQHNGMVSKTGYPNRFDQALFAQMPEVSRPGIGGAIMMVAEITTGDHPEGADGRQRTRFGASQRVLAVAVAHEFALLATRQVEVARERLAWVQGTCTRLTVALRPSRIVTVVAAFMTDLGFAGIP